MWDSTHNMTRYDYKLSSFTLIDAEGTSRSVLFHLTLVENAESLSHIEAWHKTFQTKPPRVVFTDGDQAMKCALSAISYHDEIIHLLCIHHLFDTNVREVIQPIISSKFGSNTWVKFRRSLSICREAGSVSQFDKLWEDMIAKWLPSSEFEEKARF